MKLNDLLRLHDALEILADISGLPQWEIIDRLTGLCWDLDEANQIKSSLE